MNFDNPVTAILPVIDMERARRFYEQQLGLEAGAPKPDGKFVFRCGGTEIALFPRPGGAKAEHTALSFRVGDIRAAIHEHVCVLGSEKAAWFQDPEGNILCLHEDIPGVITE